MNVMKNIKGVQSDKHSKTNSHPLIGQVNENDIVKLVPNHKIASVTKIKTKLWNSIYQSDLKIMNYTLDKFNNIFFTGYVNTNISIHGSSRTFDWNLSQTNCTDIFIARVRNGELIYIKFVPGLKNDKAYTINIDSHNDIYICGYYTDSITFDSIYLSKEGDQQNLFIAKLDGKTWEWIWAKDAGVSHHRSKCKNLIIYHNHVYISGYFDREIIFDTIPVQEFKTEGINIFIAEMDVHNGDWNWIVCSSGMGIVKSKYMEIRDERIYITGYLQGNITFDNELNNTNKNIFICSMNLKGNWIFEKIFCGDESYGKCIKVDTYGHIYLIGNYKKYLNIDDYKLYNNSDQIINNGFIVKLNRFGSLIWIKSFKSNLENICYDLHLDFQNYLYIVGTLINNIQIDNINYSANNNKSFFLKMSGNGNIILFDICNTYLTNIQIYNFDGFYLGGYDKEYKYNLIKYIPDDRFLKCLGIVRTPHFSKNKEIIDIEFNGNISVGYKDLEPGFDYYIQDTGDIDIIPNEFYFGTALSENKMLLK